MPSKAILTGVTAEKKNILKTHSLPLVHLVASSQDQVRNRMRETISRNLTDSFRIPEVVEGLVEYLLEIFPNDPEKSKLLGVKNQTSS